MFIDFMKGGVNLMSERQLKIEEVAVLVGVSVKTMNNWYWFKRENPDNEYAQMLPEYQQERPTSARLWNYDDISKLIEFKNHVIRGRNGKMGTITQKYVKKEKTNE